MTSDTIIEATIFHINPHMGQIKESLGQMPQGPQTEIEVKRKLAVLAAEGETSAAAVKRFLDREFAGTEIVVPSEKTIGRELKKLLPPDASGPWSLAEASPDEAARVLPAVTSIVEMTRGRVWPTRELVRWIDRIVAAAPDIPAWPAYWAAFQMRAAAALVDRARQDEALARLTVQLGCRPWTPAGRQRWRRLQAQAPPSPVLDALLDTLDFTLPGEAETAADDDGEGVALLQQAYRDRGQSHSDYQEN